MYSTSMSAADPLQILDAAILSLRRFAAPPPGAPSITHGGAPVDLSTVLVVEVVSHAGRSGISVSGTAEALQVTPSTASRLVDRAVDAGMIARAPDETDPRRRLLTLTSAGRRLHRAGVRHRTRRLGEVTAHWSERDLARLATLLERFTQDLHTPRPEAHS